MSLRQKRFLILFITSLVGFLIPHIGVVFVTVSFSLILLIPVLLFSTFYLLVTVIKSYRRKDRARFSNAFIGLSTLILFVITPFISVLIVDEYYQYKAKSLIKELETFKSKNFFYPESVTVLGRRKRLPDVIYSYHPDTKHYSLHYNSGALITTKYDSRYRQWRRFGWND